jgi:gamma-glutamylcyclotransferase (GGCT)/AIG2-like uncharacterized protein YtfP
MALYFAYGSNISEEGMRSRCPQAQAIGPARLDGWRFIINTDGYASIVPSPGGKVHGVLWRLSARDLRALNAYEAIDCGLYVRRMLPVRCANLRHRVLVFIARRSERGRPRPGYLASIVAAARDWQLPEAYVSALGRWSASRWRGARAIDAGEAR